MPSRIGRGAGSIGGLYCWANHARVLPVHNWLNGPLREASVCVCRGGSAWPSGDAQPVRNIVYRLSMHQGVVRTSACLRFLFIWRGSPRI